MTKKEYEKEGSVQGCFIGGSEVRLIVLYPFPKDMKMKFGNKKPLKKIIKWYSNYEPELMEENGNWQLVWTEAKIKRYLRYRFSEPFRYLTKNNHVFKLSNFLGYTILKM